MESVWAVFKRSLHGTWHHVSEKHLPRYVNEATIRLNDDNVRRDTINRMEALAMQHGRQAHPIQGFGRMNMESEKRSATYEATFGPFKVKKVMTTEREHVAVEALKRGETGLAHDIMRSVPNENADE